MDICPGTITVEYYDGTSEFTNSDVSECPSPREISPTVTASTSHSSTDSQTQTQTAPKSETIVSCKTYDFEHVSSGNESGDDNEPARLLDNAELKTLSVSELAREAMMDHYLIDQQERMEALIHPRASFPRCPRGDVPDVYSRRKHPGPFLTCSFAHSHECGDDFARLPIPTKPSPEINMSTRPIHLKEKKAKFFKQCKNCESIAFTHHRNPARHYEEYLNNVTYKQHSDHSKVWQQHVVDLMYTLGNGEDSNDAYVDESIFEQCQNYKPSPALIRITHRALNPHKRTYTLVTKRKTPIARQLRRTSNRASARKGITPRWAPSSEAQNMPQISGQIDDTKQARRENDSPSELTVTEMIVAPAPRIRDHSSTRSYDSVDDEPDHDTPRDRINAAVKRIVNYKNVSPKVARRFVRKPEPPTEAKYIQKGRPNISAKFLRARSKNRIQNAEQKMKAVHPIDKKMVTDIRKDKESLSKDRHAAKASSVKNESSDEEDMSYAMYRDKNGEFDAELYRQSILKMLAAPKDSSALRKKKLRKSAISERAVADLPKIKNAYRNVKPRIVSNLTRRRRRKGEMEKGNDEEILETRHSSEASLPYFNEDESEQLANSMGIPAAVV